MRDLPHPPRIPPRSPPLRWLLRRGGRRRGPVCYTLVGVFELFSSVATYPPHAYGIPILIDGLDISTVMLSTWISLSVVLPLQS